MDLRVKNHISICILKIDIWRDGRVVEGARLESVYRGNSIMGSNPILSAIFRGFHQDK